MTRLFYNLSYKSLLPTTLPIVIRVFGCVDHLFSSRLKFSGVAYRDTCIFYISLLLVNFKDILKE